MNLEIIKNFLEENGFSINLDDDNKIIDIKDNLTNQLLQTTIGGYVSDDGSIRIYIDDSRVFIYKNGLFNYNDTPQYHFYFFKMETDERTFE